MWSVINYYIYHDYNEISYRVEKLFAGENIEGYINCQYKYKDLIEFYSLNTCLYMMGYLKIDNYVAEYYTYYLSLTNKEVKAILENLLSKHFDEYKSSKKEEFANALRSNDEEAINIVFSDILGRSISYPNKNEEFYSNLVTELLDDYKVELSKDDEEGIFNIEIIPNKTDDKDIIFKCRCSNAIYELIPNSRAIATTQKEIGTNDKMYYGVSFYKEQCFITKA